MRRSIHRGRKGAALVAVVVLVATACSKSAPATPIYDVFAQKFRFNGMPASTGNLQINFSNKESFPITHEMILNPVPNS